MWLKITLGLSGILILLGLCITESRGAFISLFVALGYYLLSSKTNLKFLHNWKIYLSIGLLIIGGLYLLALVSKNKTESTSGRFFTTQQVIKQILEKPFGYGLNSFSVEYNKAKATYFEKNSNWEKMKNAGYIYKANNDLLELTFELGIPFTIFFIFFTLLLFWKKCNKIETQIARTILLGLLLFSLTTSIIMMPVLVIIACICSVKIVNTSRLKVIYELKNRGIYRFLAIGLSLSFTYVLITRINAENNLYRLFEDKMYLKAKVNYKATFQRLTT